jgi:Ca2+-binding RTX toxin-like protein
MEGNVGDDTYVVDHVGDVVEEAMGAGADTVRSAITLTLADNVENLVLTGISAINGVGNELANLLVGNSAANVLDGGLGADNLQGGLGNDTYVVDETGDAVVEASSAGTDVVQSAISWALAANVENLLLTGADEIDGTGNGLANTISGNAAANILDGGAAADAMAGGLGNDTYVVDHASDVVTEAAGAGIDLVQSSITHVLAANVENLTLVGGGAINGTGNTLVNALTGNAAANILNGGTGADAMIGGLGNDTYIVDNAGDMVTEAAGAGIDLVQASVTHALAADVENLTLTGAGAINGTGNSLANAIIGNAGANTLDGAGGADTMTGGLGNDTYVVDNALDKAVEAAGGGTDRC